jgi:hypothetical protein
LLEANSRAIPWIATATFDDLEKVREIHGSVCFSRGILFFQEPRGSGKTSHHDKENKLANKEDSPEKKQETFLT